MTTMSKSDQKQEHLELLVQEGSKAYRYWHRVGEMGEMATTKSSQTDSTIYSTIQA